MAGILGGYCCLTPLSEMLYHWEANQKYGLLALTALDSMSWGEALQHFTFTETHDPNFIRGRLAICRYTDRSQPDFTRGRASLSLSGRSLA